MTLPNALSGLGEIAGDYDILLCDVWGVIHNGRESWPAACEALARFNREGGHVILISNSPRPGPGVITSEPALFWGVIASMWIGNVLLVVLNLPLIGLWVKLLLIPYRILFPAIIAFACIGTFSINQNAFDIYAIAVLGIVGYVLVKFDCEPAPLLLGFVLGPLLEEHLRRAMMLSRGDPLIFFERPISAALLAFAALAIILSVMPSIRKKRDEVFVEED